MIDTDKKVKRPFFRNATYDKMAEEIEDVLNRYAVKGISRCEVVGCLEFLKLRIMDDD